MRPIAEVTHSLMGAFASARVAADTIAAVIASGVVPAAVEWLDRAGIAGLQQFYDTGYPLDADSIVLIDVDGTAAEVAHDQPIVERVLREHATEVRVAEDEKDRAALWYGRLNAPNSVVQSGKGFFIGDVTVPRDRIPEMQEAIQATAARHSDGLLFIAVCGHAGDGDLHPTTFYDKDNPLAASALEAANNEIIEAALDLGGTITGEHGVGTEKIQFMTKRFTPVEIAAQRSIKKAFDPAGLLNPGIMLPDRSPEEPDTSTFGAAVRAALTGGLHPDPTAPLTAGGNTDIAVNLGNLSLVVGADATVEADQPLPRRARRDLRCDPHLGWGAHHRRSRGHRHRRRTGPHQARSARRRRHRHRRPDPGPLRRRDHEGRRRIRHQTALHRRARRVRRPDDPHLQDRRQGLTGLRRRG